MGSGRSAHVSRMGRPPWFRNFSSPPHSAHVALACTRAVPAHAPRVDAHHASTAAAHPPPAAFLQAPTPVPRLQQPEQRPAVPPPRLALPPTVNWHLEPRCNYHCKFCFATFSDIPAAEVVKDADLLLAVRRCMAVGRSWLCAR